MLKGHTSIRTTLDRYGHLMKGLDDAQIGRMNQTLGGDGGTYVARARDKRGDCRVE
jgi:hypothetical protein